MVQPVLSEPARYLGQAAIGRRLGVSRHQVATWRNRYRNSPTPFPQPDAWIGDGEEDERAIPGWLPGRLEEIREWRKSLPGQGAGGGRPRSQPHPK
jgi:hypothetical protein